MSPSSQAQEPSVFGVVSTESAFSTEALSVTRLGKLRAIGIAMPYVWPSPTLRLACVCRFGLTVVNVPPMGTFLPSAPAAWPDQV